MSKPKVPFIPPLPPKGTVANDKVTCLVLDNGNKIISTSEKHMAGDYVRVVSKDGVEIGYWDNLEWQEDPIVVMGAILRCAAKGEDSL